MTVPITIWILLLIALLGVVSSFLTFVLANFFMKQRKLDNSLPIWLHVIMPMVMIVLCGYLFLHFGMQVKFFYLMVMAVITAVISIVDLKHRVIPNQLIMSIFIITAAFVLIGHMQFDWISSLFGLIMCLVMFLFPTLLGKNIGMGDVKLASAIGFAAGLMGSLYTIVLMGGFVLVLVLVRPGFPIAATIKQFIPMGPFISVAFMVIQVAL